ncbi:MAG TPA: ankyrin repeat domain-containing protein [Candidatus Babeliales bacterium]|nr:ankyrin repeat domain-containing protein [Candidatus Babeliales bacterium]
MKRFIKNGLVITVLINFGLSLQVHAAKPTDPSAKRAQERLKRIGGQLQQPKQQSAIAPEDVAATSQFLEKPEYCERIKRTWKDELKKYGNAIIEQMLDNEERYKDDYFVFYHAQQQDNRLVVECLKNLYNWSNQNKKQSLRSDFEFLRFWADGSDFKDVNSYLDSFGIPNPFAAGKGRLNDDRDDIRAVLMAVNPVLFGNFDWDDECTWSYFLQNKSIQGVVKHTLETILQKYGFAQNAIDQTIVDLFNINKIFPIKTGDIIQIFIPKKLVDDCAYLSRAWGVPQKDPILSRYGSPMVTQIKYAHDDIGDYDSLHQRYVRCHKILELLQNQGSLFKDSKSIQLRLFFSKAGPLLNPDMGAKMFRFTTLTPQQLQEYKRHVAAVSAKLFAQYQEPLLRRMKKSLLGNKEYAVPAEAVQPRPLTPQEKSTVSQALDRLSIPEVFEAVAMPNAIEMIKNSLAKGADINAKDDNGKTGLMIAVEKGLSKVAEFLIEQKANLDVHYASGDTLLIVAVRTGQIPIIDALIRQKVDLNIQDSIKKTALMYAARNGDLAMVKLLVGAGADVDIKDSDIGGLKAWEIAQTRGHAAVVAYLKEAHTKRLPGYKQVIKKIKSKL